MMKPIKLGSVLLAAGAICLGVLGFYGNGQAAPRATNQQFSNAISQRQEIIEQLRENNRLLRQQNALLTSGKIVVSINQRSRN